jgi:DNA invertase Pin-like site-specific DNA recombinase
MTLGVMATMAQYEAEVISARTKAALLAAKARGVELGGRRQGSADIRSFQQQGQEAAARLATERLRVVESDLRALKARGLSLSAIAGQLNASDVRSPRGAQWTATTVRRAIMRLGYDGHTDSDNLSFSPRM